MTSIRCKNCNLINFSTAMQCKKCKQPLNEYSNFADENQYPTDFEEDYQLPHSAQMSCIKCGSRNRVSLQNFKKDYIPPISYIGFFMGILPGLILVRLLKIKHYLSAPFCHGCWENFRKVSINEIMGFTGLFLGFFAGIFALVVTESVLIMLLIFAAAFGLAVWSQLYKSKHSPNYKKVSRQEIIISDPRIGDISFAK